MVGGCDVGDPTVGVASPPDVALAVEVGGVPVDGVVVVGLGEGPGVSDDPVAEAVAVVGVDAVAADVAADVAVNPGVRVG